MKMKVRMMIQSPKKVFSEENTQEKSVSDDKDVTDTPTDI